jgi:hypothetical protein
MSRAPLSRVLRSSRKQWSRFRRSSVGRSPYYRRHPLELGRLILAVRRLRLAGVSEPGDFLAHLGIDVEETSDDFDRWRGVLAAVLAGRSRVGISEGQGRILYAAVRALRPSHVIETGVAEGVSSSYIGAALVDNGLGVIHSLELPPDHVPDDSALEDGGVYAWQHKGVAFLVPNQIRTALGERWDIRLGDVRETLPTLLAELDVVDLFFHDDLHLPGHMLWEYELVWPRIPPGGLLLSDDANAGWITFAGRHLADGDGLVNYRRTTGARRP